MRFGIFFWSLGLGFCRLLAGNGFHACDITTNFQDTGRLLKLASGLLEAQIELLLLS
jgi:hypothetical protein